MDLTPGASLESVAFVDRRLLALWKTERNRIMNRIMNPLVEELEPRCVLDAAVVSAGPLQTGLLQADLVRELLPPPRAEDRPITIFTNPPVRS